MPAGKTPLFIGGSGVTLEQIAKKIYICIYPTARTAEETMTLPGERLSFSVHLVRKGVGTSLPLIRVTDHRGYKVETVQQGYATAFFPKAGEVYRVIYQ